ncbi:MAG: ATP synthase subunit I [Alphaproteobacteria bacterium]|nr:ATP synthase subunit I [Alphaproteobacteria bacterium]
MTHSALIAHTELTITMAIAGCIFGWHYFAMLKRSVALFVGGKGRLGVLALTLGRMGAAAAFLFVAAKLGAASLLATFTGFLLARALVLRAEKRTG